MSTAQNLRMLFNTYHNGFDNYGAWYGRHKTMHAKHPLECKEFGAEWLRRWEEIGRLLDAPAIAEFWSYPDNRWIEFDWSRVEIVGVAIPDLSERYSAEFDDTWGQRYRVSLLNGTIVKEWGTP